MNHRQIAGTCWNMLEHAGTCWNMLEHAGTCWNMLEHAGTYGIGAHPSFKPIIHYIIIVSHYIQVTSHSLTSETQALQVILWLNTLWNQHQCLHFGMVRHRLRDAHRLIIQLCSIQDNLHAAESPDDLVTRWMERLGKVPLDPNPWTKHTPKRLDEKITLATWNPVSVFLSFKVTDCHTMSQRFLTCVPFPWIQNFYQYTTRWKKCKNLGPTSFSTELLNIAHLHFLLQLSDRHVWWHFQTATFATQQFHLDPHCHGGHGLWLRKSWTTHCEARVCPKMGGYPRY